MTALLRPSEARKLIERANTWAGKLDDAGQCIAAEVISDLARALEATLPRPIEEAVPGKYLLWFPGGVSRGRRYGLPPMFKVDTHPVHYPRKPTLWWPLPKLDDAP